VGMGYRLYAKRWGRRARHLHCLAGVHCKGVPLLTKLRVPATRNMTTRTFIQHVELRHPILKYWSVGEHNVFHFIFFKYYKHYHRGNV